MKITFLGHATLLIEIEEIKILIDPWVSGPAYCEQWYLFPKPPPDVLDYLQEVHYILVSHGHEDHLHEESLKKINKNAHVFFPYTWYDGAIELFTGLGFNLITEAINEKEYLLQKDLSITFLANNLDNVIVIKYKDEILVDVNDALTSAPQGIIHHFIKKIKSKWPHINYLFSSYGGASYFPNTIKYGGKNDLEVGKIKEQFILNNFCKIAKELNATFSIPFASDFVLLDDSQRWINEVKVSRSEIKKYFEEHFADQNTTTQMMELYPGDIMDNEKFFFLSTYHEKFKHSDIATLSQIEYNDQIIEKRKVRKICKSELEDVYLQIKNQVKKKIKGIPEGLRKHFKFAIQITDSEVQSFIEIDLGENEPRFQLREEFQSDNQILVKLKSQTILYSITKEWGGDAIVIGYGCEIDIFSEETIRQQLENYAIQLLTNYPDAKSNLKKNPIRSFHYIANDKLKREIIFKKIWGKKIPGSPFIDDRLGDKEMWLTRTNCEICRKCNLPVLSEENTQHLIEKTVEK